MKFSYYPGCSAKGSSADYEKSTQAVCAALGMYLEELPGWNCCGSTPAHAVDTELSAALCVRNLDIAAREQAETVLTPCPSCLSNLRHAAKRMENPEFRARVDELLDSPAAAPFPPVCPKKLPVMSWPFMSSSSGSWLTAPSFMLYL